MNVWRKAKEKNVYLFIYLFVLYNVISTVKFPNFNFLIFHVHVHTNFFECLVAALLL
jgi:hypothetical protein